MNQCAVNISTIMGCLKEISLTDKTSCSCCKVFHYK